MLIVEDDGVIITLNGKEQDPLFWWSMILLLLGVLVAIICLVAPVFYAIGALALFAVVVFMFNIQRQKAKNCHIFSQGRLKITPKRFEIHNKSLTLSASATVSAKDNKMTIVDRGIEYHFTGFADDCEINIAKQVLLGKSIKTNSVAVTLANK